MVKTPEELRLLAKDFANGKIFSNHNPKELRMDFPIMKLLSKESIDNMLAQKPVLFFEYIDKAISSVDRPQFKTFKYIIADEYKEFMRLCKIENKKLKRKK